MLGLDEQNRSREACDAGRPSGKVTGKKVRQILELQGYRCALTGWELTPENCHGDHIIPVASGGLNVAENIQLVIDKVNWAKGTMSQDEFIDLCRAVVEHHA